VETEKAQFFLEGRGKFYGSQRLTVVSRWPWLSPLEPREQSIDFGSEDSSLADETIAFLSFVAGKAEQIKVATAQEALAVMSLLDDCYRQATGSRQAEVSSK
jgi:predicted dehydrogenase